MAEGKKRIILADLSGVTDPHLFPSDWKYSSMEKMGSHCSSVCYNSFFWKTVGFSAKQATGHSV